MYIDILNSRFHLRLVDDKPKEPQKAGMAGYWTCLGWLLVKINFAICVSDEAGQKFYLNRKSAIKYINRHEGNLANTAKDVEIDQALEKISKFNLQKLNIANNNQSLKQTVPLTNQSKPNEQATDKEEKEQNILAVEEKLDCVATEKKDEEENLQEPVLKETQIINDQNKDLTKEYELDSEKKKNQKEPVLKETEVAKAQSNDSNIIETKENKLESVVKEQRDEKKNPQEPVLKETKVVKVQSKDSIDSNKLPQATITSRRNPKIQGSGNDKKAQNAQGVESEKKRVKKPLNFVIYFTLGLEERSKAVQQILSKEFSNIGFEVNFYIVSHPTKIAELSKDNNNMHFAGAFYITAPNRGGREGMNHVATHFENMKYSRCINFNAVYIFIRPSKSLVPTINVGSSLGVDTNCYLVFNEENSNIKISDETVHTSNLKTLLDFFKEKF